jgi:5-(carboxyamino)imidazole ribonucleotide synthase
VGVLGAGQLGRMLALAGAPLGITCRFLDPSESTCAAAFGEHVSSEYDDSGAIERFCGEVDVATFEFENVPAETARAVGERIPMRPGAESLERTQDRLSERAFVRDAGARVAAHARVDDADSLDAAISEIGLPALLKTRRFGYDGKGQVLLHEPSDVDAGRQLAGRQPCILEAFVEFEREVSIIVVRAEDGACATFPMTENLHAGGILRASIAPAADSGGTGDEARRIGETIAERLGHIGALCVELFETARGLLVNEIAPRVHNSGHWTIDGARASQFENHLRAVCGWPLGPSEAIAPSVMLNLIGEAPAASDILSADPAARVHLYGKSARPGRKLGHLTVVDEDREALARRVRALAGLPGVHRESALAAAERATVS